MVKGLICQANITIVNIYACNNGTKYMKQKLTNMKGETDNSIGIG